MRTLRNHDSEKKKLQSKYLYIYGPYVNLQNSSAFIDIILEYILSENKIFKIKMVSGNLKKKSAFPAKSVNCEALQMFKNTACSYILVILEFQIFV